MTTAAHIRKTASSLPEVKEGKHFGMVSFTVRGKGFVSLSDDGWLQLPLPSAEVEAMLASLPAAERVTRGSALLGTRVPLAELNGQQANHWVRRAWLHRAPKRLAAAATAAETARAGQVGDLPRAIGNPATRALVAAGVTSLSEVAEHTEKELLAMHGVGSRAVAILSQTLAERGRYLRGV